MSKRKQKQQAKTPARDNTRTPPPPAAPRKTTPRATPAATGPKRPLTFGRETYKWLGIGFALVMIGLFLMAGARNPDPTVFDTSDMYSWRRITLAPIVILSGLGTVVYALLKK